jgi:hypothetical protein
MKPDKIYLKKFGLIIIEVRINFLFDPAIEKKEFFTELFSMKNKF